MRTTTARRRAAGGALGLGVLLLTGACSIGGGDAPVRIATDQQTPFAVPSTDGPGDPGGSGGSGGSGSGGSRSGGRLIGDQQVCAQVVAGINAFNTGDYAGSVKDFQVAVPLARAALKRTHTVAAQDLLDAVRYYAHIDPDAYQAALGTPEFTKYQVITLSQCMPPDDGGGSGSDGGGVAI